MQLAIPLLAAAWLFATAGGVRAQALDPKAAEIEWSKDRKLRRADFKGALAVASDVAARSTIVIKASWSCDGDRLSANIRAVFDQNESWWGGTVRNGWDPRRGSVSDAQLLQHEQTHFDLAEIVARKIRGHFADLADVCTRRGGTVPLAAIVEEYQHELDAEQARYDRETGFGRDARMQWTWTSKASKAVRTP
jgi:hypothetical protein